MVRIKTLLQQALASFRYRAKLLLWIVRLKLGRNIFVFGAPFHSNMGDQAQTYCTEKWLKKEYPGYRLWIYNTQELTWGDFGWLYKIKKHCNCADKVFLHSGYHTTDLYMLEENLQRKVLELFDDRQVVILPQTVFYCDPQEAERAKQVYNAHSDVVFMCRDEVSYQTAEKLFFRCRRLLVPDIVTSMIGTKHYDRPRKGILLCLRNDKEALYSTEQIEVLKESLEQIDEVTVTDTTIKLPADKIAKNREETLEGIWEEYAGFRAIVTDRYHGTIFSLIANTPVIVLSSTDHKLSSGVKWFPESFQSYVRHIPKLENVRLAVEQIYSSNYTYQLEPYFQMHYYSTLRSRIEGQK